MRWDDWMGWRNYFLHTEQVLLHRRVIGVELVEGVVQLALDLSKHSSQRRTSCVFGGARRTTRSTSHCYVCSSLSRITASLTCCFRELAEWLEFDLGTHLLCHWLLKCRCKRHVRERCKGSLFCHRRRHSLNLPAGRGTASQIVVGVGIRLRRFRNSRLRRGRSIGVPTGRGAASRIVLDGGIELQLSTLHLGQCVRPERRSLNLLASRGAASRKVVHGRSCDFETPHPREAPCSMFQLLSIASSLARHFEGY